MDRLRDKHWEDRHRGWLWDDGWFRKEGWSIQIKFTAGGEELFFSNDDQGEFQLQDAVQHVTHVERSQGLTESNLGIEVLLADLRKPSLLESLESIDVDLNAADAAALETMIKLGCLPSLRYLRFHIKYTGYRLLTLANAMASHGLPSLETLFLSRVDLDLFEFKAYGIALASETLPKLKCFHIFPGVLNFNEEIKSFVRAIRSSRFHNWAIAITDKGLTVLVNSFRDSVARLFSYLTSPNLGLYSFAEVGQSSLAEVLNSGKLQNLTFLDVSGNDIGDEGAKPLGVAIRSGELKNLAELRLNNIGLTDEGLIALVDSFGDGVGRRLLPSLISLDIGLNSFTEVGLLSFANALSSGELRKLSCLDISGNNIGDEVANCLERAICTGELTNLAELRLNKIGLTDEGLLALVRNFQASLLSLRFLELGGNSISESGLLSLWSIGLAIRSSGDVKNFALGITNEGLSMIAVEDPFQQNVASMLQDLSSGKLHKLLCLEISGNDIGDEVAKSLGRAIRSRQLEKLVQLRLSKVGLTDEGLKALVDSFQEGVACLLPNLSLLDLASNPFTEKGTFALGEALKSGHLNSLEVLAVRRSADPSKEAARALVSALLSNRFLTLDVQFEWYKFPELDRRREQLIQRNHRNRDILAGLVTVSNVQATFGKVYLCGNPEVGKTTLCSTLQRSFWKSLITWERRPHAEKRTRGIVVSQLSSKANKPDNNPITLVVWDMAGQEDFHLVHNAFFPDLGFAEGKATTFIVVCNSKDSPDKSMEQLEYWLRYIASSCDTGVQNPRHVFVVMNKFGGGRKIRSDAKQYWKMVLENKRDKYKQHIEIQMELSLVDVRKFKQVDGLKTCLLEHSRNLLRNQEVPSICQAIQKNLSDLSQQREQFPVFHWTEFVEQIADKLQVYWPEHIIEAATKYLNEAGVLIYIDMEGIRLVVVDPTWLCREIIGKLFLPWDMASPTEDLFRKQVDQSTGSISISDFKKFFKSLRGEWNEAQFDHLVAILLWLGLCYKGEDENIFLPALIAERGTPGHPWSLPATVLRGRYQWVMGFSVRHQKNDVAECQLKNDLTLAQISKSQCNF